MKIDRVTFRGNIETRQFQHVHVEASAMVDAGEDPQAVLDAVKTFVASELLRARDGEKVEPRPAPGRFTDLLKR